MCVFVCVCVCCVCVCVCRGGALFAVFFSSSALFPPLPSSFSSSLSLYSFFLSFHLHHLFFSHGVCAFLLSPHSSSLLDAFISSSASFHFLLKFCTVQILIGILS